MKQFIKHILIAPVLLAGWVQVMGQPVPPQTNPPSLVVDQAEVFSRAQREKLERELVAFSDSTSNQIVVVTMRDLEGYEPWEVAYNIGKTWGVGQSGFDNGVVVLFKPKTAQSRGQVFIAVGYGLEGAIPDATAKMIVEREMIPLFKQGRVYDGIVAGVRVVKKLAVGEYNSDAYANQGGGSFGPSLIFFFFLFVFVILQKVSAARSYSVGHNIPFWTAFFLASSSSGHGGSFGNFSSGGGSFGGFGGGGFGGGGAGGSW